MSLYVKYSSIAEEAQKDMTISSDGGQLGYPAGLKAGFPDTPWATLEPGGWPLDGTRDILPDNPGNIGWWSAYPSDQNGVLAEQPTIVLSFPTLGSYAAPGISFSFWPSTNEWCNQISINWRYSEFASEEEQTTDEFPTSANFFCKCPIEKFNSIEITLISTNHPGRFAKLQSIQLGQLEIFFQNELVRVSLLNETDPSSCELSADELTVEIRDSKKRDLYIDTNHSLQLYQNDNLIASHYIKEYSSEGENKITIKAQSVISLLEDRFLGGLYEKELLEDLLGSVLAGIPFSVDPYFSEKTVTGYLPACSKREALQQIAFAVGAYITTQGDGTVQIKQIRDPRKETPSGGFGKNKIFSGSRLSKVKVPKEIQVSSHSYSQSPEAAVEVLATGVSVVDLPETLVDEVLLVFSEPHYDYDCKIIEGGPDSMVSTEGGANWVRIKASPDAVIEVTGRKYAHTVQNHTWTNPDAPALNGGTVKVENVTLITNDNVQEAISRLISYYSLTNSLSGDVVVDKQKAGDIVEIANPLGNNLTVGYITKMESEFTANGHTARIEVCGAERMAKDAEVLKV